MKKQQYFGTDGIRGRVGKPPINAEFVLKLGWAIGQVLGCGSKVLIGKDTRISGYMFESALEAGLSAAGVEIELLGPMPTPAIAYLTRTLRAQAGIVISASHNPYYDNGIKVFSAQGSKLPDELELAIEEYLALPMTTVESAKLGKASRVVDASGRYIEFCKSTVSANTTLKGMKIVVDCANGATYHVAPDVFRELGAEVIEINTKPDGFNINDNCGSTNPAILQKIVLAERADLGVAMDGDGDRVTLVDGNGEALDGDELLYIIAKHHLKNNGLKGGVVGTVMSNLGVEQAMKELGIEFVRSHVGDRHVMEELKRRNWLLGGEPSGHIIWLGATTTGDGIVAALQVISAMLAEKQSLHELKRGLHKFPQVIINVECKTKINSQFLEQAAIKDAINAAESELAHQGRVLLRPSGTEPLLRIMVEGEDKSRVQGVGKQLASVINGLLE